MTAVTGPNTSSWRRIGAAALVTALWGLTAQADPPERLSGRMTCDDAELIALIKRAEGRRVTPQAVERFVGRRATINTDRDGLDVVRLIRHFGGDVERRRPTGDDEPPLPDWGGAKHVVYWVRPLETRNPRCVGIIWGRDGVPRVCFFIIYPP